MVRKESPNIFQTTFGPLFHKIIMYKQFKWCISDRRSVSDRLKARVYPCAKGYNSSASQWLSGEQVRLCSGHPKVHFGTIVEGSGGRGGGCTVGPPGSLTTTACSAGTFSELFSAFCGEWYGTMADTPRIPIPPVQHSDLPLNVYFSAVTDYLD